MEVPTGGLAALLIGGLLLFYSATVIYGWFLGDSEYVKRRRATYETRLWHLFPFAPERGMVMLPFLAVSALAIGSLSFLASSRLAIDVLLATAAVGVGLGLLAFLWPRPFMPAWAKALRTRRNERVTLPDAD
jgi:hypothetical protein